MRRFIRRISIARVLLLAFTTLVVAALGGLYAVNIRMLQRNLRSELTEYARRHTASLEVLIQQDLISGFYPAVIQRASRFVDRETIPRVEIRLADGTLVYAAGAPLQAGLERLDMPVLANASGLEDPSGQHVIATISAWVSFARVDAQVDHQRQQALSIWLVCLVLTLAVTAILSARLSRPLQDLATLAAERDLERLAAYVPGSRFKELHRLETELVALSRQTIESGAAARTNAQYAAIARTTQMLAHDVRKPFSTLRLGLEAVRDVSDEGELRRALDRLLPEVRQAMETVNGMLLDIMELKPEAKLATELVAPEALVAQALAVPRRDDRAARTRVVYAWGHTRRLDVHPIKMMRVLVNLVDNAAQAVDDGGTLWIRSTDDGDAARPMIKLVVGNSGSYIPLADRERLFEAFYTKNKIDGTGLGLAIAEHVVRAHAGRIWCESELGKGTEFAMLLPAGGELGNAEETRLLLPTTLAKGGTRAPSPVRGASAASPQRPRASRPLVLIIDDDVFVREAWQATMTDAEPVCFASPAAFWQAWERDADLRADVRAFVIDYHFGDGASDGATLARQLAAATAAPIFLASDGDFAAADVPEVAAIIGKSPRLFRDLGRP